MMPLDLPMQARALGQGQGVSYEHRREGSTRARGTAADRCPELVGVTNLE
jgi:hypothetical protein